LRHHRCVEERSMTKGDYVLATKWNDGDPGDPWCVGYFDSEIDCGSEKRFLVVDAAGAQFYRNGFRRMQKISTARGNWLVAMMPAIEKMMRFGSHRTVWGWARLPMKDYPPRANFSPLLSPEAATLRVLRS
jgi:hypothetical protein